MWSLLVDERQKCPFRLSQTSFMTCPFIQKFPQILHWDLCELHRSLFPVCCALAFERRALQSTRCITRAMKLILCYFWIVIFPLIVKVPVHGMTDVRIGVGPVSELFCPHQSSLLGSWHFPSLPSWPPSFHGAGLLAIVALQLGWP